MFHSYPILSQGVYYKQQQNEIELENEEEEVLFEEIESFIISPNSKFMTIITYLVNENQYSLQVLNLQRKSQSLYQHYFNDYVNQWQFCQFSSDSKYLVYHISKSQKLHILDLQSLLYQEIEKIEEVYKLDDKNQIFVRKNKSIQIYQIEEFFQIDSDLGLKNQTQSFSKKISKQLIEQGFILDTHLIQHSLVIRTFYRVNKRQIFITDNKLFIVQYKPFFDNFIQLRNLPKGRLLRKMRSKHMQQITLIQDNNSFYVCNVKDKKQLAYSQFNLILGLTKQMILQIPDPQDEVYITNSILVDIDKNNKLRYFVFKNIE